MERISEDIDEIRRKFELLPNKTPDNQEIQLDYREHEQVQIAIITIKSGSKNALSGKMISQLTGRLDDVELWTQQGSNDARCLLIMGHGGTFCSGSDLVSVRHTLDERTSEQLAQLMQYNFKRIADLPVISVAYVEGYALGGGAELAISADLTIMSGKLDVYSAAQKGLMLRALFIYGSINLFKQHYKSKIGFVHARNGICCGWGGGRRLVQLVGRARALELLSSGRLIDAEEAQKLGLTCSCIELDSQQTCEIPESVLRFCSSHAVSSTITSRALKLLVQAASELPVNEALQEESRLFVSTWGKAAHLEALSKNLKHKN